MRAASGSTTTPRRFTWPASDSGCMSVFCTNTISTISGSMMSAWRRFSRGKVVCVRCAPAGVGWLRRRIAAGRELIWNKAIRASESGPTPGREKIGR